jgi:hypothetical protein
MVAGIVFAEHAEFAQQTSRKAEIVGGSRSAQRALTGQDTRTLLYKKLTGRSRPFETEREEAFVRAYAACVINNRPSRGYEQVRFAHRHRLLIDDRLS